jgi:hypothetical protein
VSEIAVRAMNGRSPKWLSEYAVARDKAWQAEIQAETEACRKDPKLAERRAGERFPELLKKDSPLNKEFLRRLQQYRTEKPAFFQDPRWPIVLAEESFEAVDTAPSQLSIGPQ